jgi:hypothetical protein
MSELQIALAALAGALLLGLFLKGKWDERAARRRAQSLGADLGDVRLDPVAGRAPVAPDTEAASQSAVPGQRIEPRLGPLPDAPGADFASGADHAAPVKAGDWVEDPLIDYALELRCTRPVDGVAALAAANHLQRLDLPLPTHLAVWDGRTQQWCAPDRFGFYTELLIALQLADRRGAITEIDASRFVTAAQHIALELDAEFEPPDVPDLLAQANDLDSRVARFDVRLSLRLRSSGAPFSVEAVAAAAQGTGFAPVGPERWLWRDADGRPVLTLATQAPLSDIAMLALDVPVAPVAAQPLELLFNTARDLAARLGAQIVDESGRPLASTAAVAINEQLGQLYQQMHDVEIEPGSARALRLFVVQA